MRFLPWILIFAGITLYSFLNYTEKPEAVSQVIDRKVYQDTIVFGDSVLFMCTRCGQINEQYLYIKVIVPKCN